MIKTKWQSRRWWVCVWAMVLLTSTLILSYIKIIDVDWMSTLVMGLLGIIGGWLGSETITKPKVGKGNEQ
jgi:uncharacterized membrane protein YfcA